MENKWNKRESDKASRERQIFHEFANAANEECNLQLDQTSIESNRPPDPDIKCQIGGKLHFFEMVEIADEDLARNVSTSIKEVKITGGAFSQDFPLIRAFESKAQKSYPVLDGQLELLAYYDKQFPPPVGGLQESTLSKLHFTIQKLSNDLNWNRVWVFDSWNRRILGFYPSQTI